jgi:DNA mismatch endonuclease, patch repair protein
MRAIRAKDTKPEMLVRSLTHCLGFRFRLHSERLPGKPDLVFTGRRKVIFVHGCFWHQHPSKSCTHNKLPKKNAHYWIPKLTRNTQRDAENIRDLQLLGWKALVVWECETKDAGKLASRIKNFLRAAVAPLQSRGSLERRTGGPHVTASHDAKV